MTGPSRARDVAVQTQGRGYNASGNNCLDHVWDSLDAYGVEGLPWKQTHPSPNDWVAAFNGEFYNI